METNFEMKKSLVVLLASVCVTVQAQVSQDSVIMTVAGKQVPVSEFLFMAQKNSEVDLTDAESAEAYVELYKNFKLKVADAEALGLDQTPAFKEEYEEYKMQLTESFLSDKKAEEAFARTIYNRGDEVLDLSHIAVRLPNPYFTKDTVPAYRDAMKIYDQLKNGADIDALGAELSGDNTGLIAYERIRGFRPLTSLKAFENVVYLMKEGEISLPVRTNLGFHVIKLHKKSPNQGMVSVSQIMIGFPEKATDKQKKKTFAEAQKVYKLIEKGQDFGELAKAYSTDSVSASKGGLLPLFAQGMRSQVFEEAAFTLSKPGDVSGIIETENGYVILRLIEKVPQPSFDSQKAALIRKLGMDEYNFELYRSFDNWLKKESGYVFYPEAYAELQALCNDYFPDSNEFFEKAKNMKKTLLTVNGDNISQSDFAYYMIRNPFSTKSYSGDFMQEVYAIFVRETLTAAERENIEKKHPEVVYLLQEYRDGTLLFEVSNQKIWSKPVSDQQVLEAQWLKELNEKYPVQINWPVIRQFYKK